MATIIGSARVDERGKYSGGAKGDQKQTGIDDFKGEVSMQNFYVHSKGWYILRPKDPVIAAGIAIAMKTACNNKHVGYSQSDRYGIVQHGVDSTVNCNGDCSTTIRACVKKASGKDVGDFTTANEATVLESSGLFMKRITFVSEAKTPLYIGDVLVTRSKGHTVAVTDGNVRPESIQAAQPVAQPVSSSYYPKCASACKSLVSALAAAGEKDTSLTNRKKIAAANGMTAYNGSATQNTKLLDLMKKGQLKRPGASASTAPAASTSAQSSAPAKQCYPKYTGTAASITVALNAVGEKDTSYTHRKKIAAANSVANYSGTADQNTKLMNLLKQGKLIKA